MKKSKVINIETGRPTVEVAERRLSFEISTAKREGVAVLKVIHGYGSSGAGGRIKEMVGRVLAARKREGNIKAFASGEEWSIFHNKAREILQACPELGRDRDLDSHNEGISIVLL
jgi:hypothetical protein